MYKEKYDYSSEVFPTYKESGKNIFLLCELSFNNDDSQEFSVLESYEDYKEAKKVAQKTADGTPVPLKFEWVADKYIIGNENRCVCQYAASQSNCILVTFVVSMPLRR